MCPPSLPNEHMGIVQPESSLARLNGCDGYIAQAWTGTSREPNRFRGESPPAGLLKPPFSIRCHAKLVPPTGGGEVVFKNDP